MKIGLSIALAIAVSSAFATPSRQTAQERNQLIWDGLHNRFVDQIDYWYDDGDYPRCIQLLRMMADLEPNDYETVTDLGFRCPDDVSIAGIDVVAWSSIVMPRITTVEQPIEELARVASLWMMEHVRGEAARTGERRCHVAEPKLVIGHSCAPPPK